MDYTIESHLIRTVIATICVVCLYFLLNRILIKITNRIENPSYKSILKWVGQGTIQYGVFILYFLYILSEFVNMGQISIFIVYFALAALLIFRGKIVSFGTGLYRVMNNIISIDDEVIINGKIKGTVREITLNSLKIFGAENSVTTISHIEVKTIKKVFKGLKEVRGSVVISFRENPEKVEQTLINLTSKLNEKYGHYLIKEEEMPIEGFTYEGITNLNADYQGIEYSVNGVVYSDDYEEVKRKIDRELAIAVYKNGLKVPEQNLFFKTRTEK